MSISRRSRPFQITSGSEAAAALGDPGFIAAWERLMDECPWATEFQGPRFVRTWFDCYADVFEPVVVRGGSDLDGLLILARDRSHGTLRPAGTHHAEYQAWLAAPADGDAFAPRAIAELERSLGRFDLTFQYLPAGAPLSWATDGALAPRTEVEEWERPLLDVADESALEEFLGRKKKLRKWLNRLKRAGELRYARFATRDELEAVIDTMVTHCDFRHGAIHGIRPFAADPRKRGFHLALLEAGILHASALFLDDVLIASHLGVTGRGFAHLGVISHSPVHSVHSPGSHLICDVARNLSAAGTVEVLDITPGGDAYKSRFASRFDHVHVVHVRANAGRVRRSRLKRKVGDAIRATIRKAGMDPRKAKDAVLGGLRNLRRPGRWIGNETEWHVFEANPATIEAGAPRFARDHLEDLLLLDAAGLSDALRRFGAGCHSYTLAEDGALRHGAWLAERPRAAALSPRELALEYPDNSAVVFDVHCGSDEMLEAALRQAAADAAAVSGTKHVFVFLPADRADRALLERVGFRRYGRVLDSTRFGRREAKAATGTEAHGSPTE